MTIRDTNNNVLSKAELQALTTAVPNADPELTVNANIYETYPYSGERTFESGRRRLFRPGQRIRQSQLNKLYDAATVSGLTPNSGPLAGGTVVTITGSNLGGVESVTFGGRAGTALSVDSQTKVRVTTPAAVGGTLAGTAVNVVVGDDSGDQTVTNGFTYN